MAQLIYKKIDQIGYKIHFVAISRQICFWQVKIPAVRNLIFREPLSH